MARATRARLSLTHRVRFEGDDSKTDRPPLLVLLHGIGSNELAMSGLAPEIDARFIVVSARGPIEVGPFAYAWFPMSFGPDGPIAEAAAVASAWRRIPPFIEEASTAYGADPAAVFVGGFSQGGMVALATLLTAPEAVAGAICMSGHLLPAAEAAATSDTRLEGKAALVVHGRGDATLDVELGRRAARLLSARPLAVTYEEFEMDHTTTPSSIQAVNRWLGGRIGG